MASHSAEGTEDNVMFFPYFWLRSESQTQVLISYKLGCWVHTDTPVGVWILSTRCALIKALSSVSYQQWILTVLLSPDFRLGRESLRSLRGPGRAQIVSRPGNQ